MMENEFLKEYVEGLKEELEYKKIVRIDDLEDENITKGELFEELNKQGISFKEPFDIYVDEYCKFEEVSEDCIYCDEFYCED